MVDQVLAELAQILRCAQDDKGCAQDDKEVVE